MTILPSPKSNLNWEIDPFGSWANPVKFTVKGTLPDTIDAVNESQIGASGPGVGVGVGVNEGVGVGVIVGVGVGVKVIVGVNVGVGVKVGVGFLVGVGVGVGDLVGINVGVEVGVGVGLFVGVGVSLGAPQSKSLSQLSIQQFPFCIQFGGKSQVVLTHRFAAKSQEFCRHFSLGSALSLQSTHTACVCCGLKEIFFDLEINSF